MKHWFFLVFLVVAVTLHVEADNEEFVKARGVQLMLNGSPYYANGFNAYWLMYIASDPSQRNKVTSTFQEAANHGLNIARTWAFSDGGYKPLQYSPGSYNEEMFQGLDFVIAEARRYGIKMVLSLVNNYENLGGKKQYVDWARSQGQSINSEDDFFTNLAVKGYYKNHIKSVLTRRNSLTGVAYKDDPTIMAWELMNEIRCPSDQSGKAVQVNHYLAAQLCFSFLGRWLNEHIHDAQNTLHKPLLFAEFGISTKKFGSNSAPRDQFFNTVYSAIYSSASGGGAAVGGLFWQLLAEGMDSFRDGYEVVLGESPSTATLIAQQSQKLNRIRKMYARLRLSLKRFVG